MNVHLEQEVPVPEKRVISPKEYKRDPQRALTERIALKKAEQSLVAGDEIKISEKRAVLEGEAMPEQMKNWYLRETLRIEKFTTIVKERRAEVESGTYPNAWDVIEAFEVTDRLVSDDVIRARQAFFKFTDELDATDTNSPAAKDKAIAQRIATRFFKETKYQVAKNSLLEGLADGGPMNCAGRFKAVAATLEKIGFNPATQIFVSETADHIRTILKTAEGQWLIDGEKIIPYVPEDGTAEMPLNDYKRELLGLDPEHRVVFGASVNKEIFGRQKSWFGKVLDKFVPEKKHEISNTRRGSYDNLKSLDVDNVARLKHLVPGPMFALMQSQLFADANSLIERTAGGSVEAAKALSRWRGTKLAAGGGLAMAMYSACGPIVEKYSEAKSPDEAATMIHSDILDVRLAMEEQINNVAKVVEMAAKAWQIEKPVDKQLDEESKTMKSNSKLSGAATSSWTDSEITEQLPITKLEMTKDDMYLLFAEQKLTYSSVDLIMNNADAQGEIDLSKPLTIDVGEARVLSPTFFKYFLQRGSKQKEANMAANKSYFLLPEVVINVTGEYLDVTTSTAAWQVAINELEETNRIQTTTHFFYDSPLSVTVNGTELATPAAVGQEDKGESPGSEEWRYKLGGVSDWHIISEAQSIALAMGETTAGHWETARDRIHEQDRLLYLNNIADEYDAVPIGFYERISTGVTHPIFTEEEKNLGLEHKRLTYRPISDEEANYIQARIDEKNNFAEELIDPRVTRKHK